MLERISSYNLFNYLLSGVLFVFLSKAFTSYSFVQQDLIIGAFVYYFIGLLISRLGSLFVEPLLKLTKFVRFAEYSDFVEACKVDSKLEVLSEQNNVYRTLIAVFIGIILLKTFEMLKANFLCLERGEVSIFLAFALILLTFGYRKQTAYIAKRTKSNIEKSRSN